MGEAYCRRHERELERSDSEVLTCGPMRAKLGTTPFQRLSTPSAAMLLRKQSADEEYTSPRPVTASTGWFITRLWNAQMRKTGAGK
jgi:hypothetical protein